MATYKGGKGPRRGDCHRRDGWSGHRDYKSGSSSPGSQRSNSTWHHNYKSDVHKEPKELTQRHYAQYLSEEWKKVEQDLHREAGKDIKITHTVEYTEKTPTDIKADELFDMVHFLKNREEKPATPD